jgi:hypothetical protein
MWLLAGSIYGGCKWLTLIDSGLAGSAPLRRTLVYLLFWPGMDARSFLTSAPSVQRPAWSEWSLAFAKTALGMLLIFGLAPLVSNSGEFAAGWVGFAGIVCLLHFGLFHLLSLTWRHYGINSPPIMDAPIKAVSLSDFWGRRWNLAFRELAHTYVFRPLVRRTGVAGATMAVFLVSGVVHDIVISVPAGAGYGLPTLYFLIQGTGVLAERSHRGKPLGLGKGGVGRVFCALLTLAPLPLLFHTAFIERVIVPMLKAIGSIP